MSTHDIPAFEEGERVEFTEELDRSPTFRVPRGATGTVEYVDEHLLSIRLDVPVAGVGPGAGLVELTHGDFPAARRMLRALPRR